MGKENVGGEKQALRNIAAYAGPLDKHKFRLIADYSYHVAPGGISRLICCGWTAIMNTTG